MCGCVHVCGCVEGVHVFVGVGRVYIVCVHEPVGVFMVYVYVFVCRYS